ncbi:MAG: hypothetical protein JWR26_3710 [Pedosphaera sp.]|nr:hypothetical protein [Pedosphaera sp.]
MGDLSSVGQKLKRSKWFRRGAIALVLYTLVGFFLVPAIIKWQMLKRLPDLTKRQVAIQQVKCNPFVLSLTIRGFSLKESNGDVFNSFDELYVNFQLFASIFKRSFVFSEISLKKPFAQVIYQPDGNFNFANLISNPAPETKTPPPPPQALPRLLIYDLSITNGAVSFADLKRKNPFHTQFLPIDVHLTNLTTIRDKNSPYSFIARTDAGESFAWSGTVSINPLRSSGRFRLGGLNLGKYSTYSHDYARFEIVNGLVDIAADYDYDSVTNALDLDVSQAAVHLTNLELKDPDTSETVLAIPALSVTRAEASVSLRTAKVGLVKSSDGSILVRRNQNGTINLLSMLNLPVAETPGTNPAAESTPAPFDAKIDDIVFDNYTVKAEDKQPGKTASFTLDQLAFTLKGVSNASNAPVNAQFSLRFQESGFIALDGTATLIPPSADLQVNLTNIDLRPIQPYVEQQVKLAITGGALDLHGHARYASGGPDAPLINFTGNLALAKFATTDDVLFTDFTKWDMLAVDGIKLDLQPDKLQVDQVKFTGLNTSLVIGPDHRANLQTILREKLGGTNTTATPAPASPASITAKDLNVALGVLLFENASIHFADQSLEPHCSFDVQEFSGSIRGLSSQADTTATVDLKGNVDSHSPFVVSGKVNPLAKELFADISVTFTNTELTAFTPYFEKFAGRPLQKGKFSLGVHYLVEKNAVKAENGIYIDQMTLGPKNNSPDATSLPVKLAIALLKDRNGRIQLDVPVQGRMDDPKFAVGPIIWHVVVNLISKAATSPFSLLGAAFGGGEELSFVTFDPGLADVSEGEAKKLDTLAKALYERPTLTVEINGSVDPDKDRLPLARFKLEQQFKSLWIKELTDSGKPAVALETVTLNQKDHDRLLKKSYRKILGHYKPSEPPTNQSPSGAQSMLIRTANQSAQIDAGQRGASRLMDQSKPVKSSPKSSAAGSHSSKPLPPKTQSQLELEDMEDQLIQKMEITSNDLRDLMQLRAARVQAYLLKTEKVTADRLFIIAPKTLTAASKGETRVNLSLD